MSLILRVPWKLDAQTSNKIIEEVAYKTILHSICIKHRLFDDNWTRLTNKCPSKWYELWVELVNKGIYSSNRREHAIMALHCMYNGIQLQISGSITRDEFLDTAKRTLIQLESKISNRYLHDLKIYKYKKPARYRGMITEKVYLLQYQCHDIMQDTLIQDRDPVPEIDYNFPMQSKSIRK